MLDWFTTIPGILIICGVVLLIIAIILFVIGAKKSKVEETVSTESIDKQSDQVNTTEMVSEVTPVASVDVEPVSSNVDTNVVSTEEVVQINEPELEVVTPQEPVVQETVVEETVMEMPNVSEIAAVEEDSSSVYGGEPPVVDFSVNEEKPVTIYGGNDPLEATQTLPKVEEHHEPYGGIYPEVRIVESTDVNEEPTPVVDVVTEMPAVEPIFDINIEEPQVEVVSDIQEETSEPTPIIIPTEEEVKSVVEEL